MLPLKPVFFLTSKYLRRVGLPQALPIGTGYTHYCDCGNKRPIYPEKVRMGFIPNSWFEFFYQKTGVTGPYMFGLGLINFLLSKEIYVCEHEFYNGISLAIMCVVGVKKFGPVVAEFCDKEIAKVEDHFKKGHQLEIKTLQKMIEHEELEQWRAEGALMLMAAKKENIALQLEAAYREAIMNVYKEVKNRLDYQVACYNIENRINHKQMVIWLIREVIDKLPKNIDESLKEKYKGDLSAIALSMK